MVGRVDTKVPINTSLAWMALQQHRDARLAMTLQKLFAEDEHRFERLSFEFVAVAQIHRYQVNTSN